jgi:hypothetical protein
VAENNCTGIYFDTTWEHWANHAPHLYMLARMTWDPRADGEAILADYYRRGFGPAAEEIDAYWTLLAAKRTELRRKGLSRFGVPEVYTPAVLEQADALLRSAERKAEGEPKYADRIALFRLGFEYSRRLIRARALMIGMEQAGMEDPETVGEVEAIWKEIDRLRKSRPLAFNNKFLGRNQRWMKGFCPRSAR